MCSRDQTRKRGHALVRKRTSGAPSRAGFSLVEVMIVIVIIGLLAGAVTINVRRYMTKAKRNIGPIPEQRRGIGRPGRPVGRGRVLVGRHDRRPARSVGPALHVQLSRLAVRWPIRGDLLWRRRTRRGRRGGCGHLQ